jgi:hypothetical protein
MLRLNRQFLNMCAFVVATLCGASNQAAAQTDEIQVYDGGIADKGKINLTWHNNYTPDGIKTPAFPGGLVSNHLYVGVTEWGFGVTDWFEAGLYLPLYAADSHGLVYNGWKLRALFVVPHADDRKFFYGSNFEFSINEKRWDEKRYTSEVRPIIGWHLKPVDVIVNPILDTSYDGLKNLVFAPCWRVAYNLPNMWAVAVEEYAEYGPLHQLLSADEQAHQLFAVIDHTTKFADIEFGLGFGLTSATDRFAIKLMFSRDLN